MEMFVPTAEEVARVRNPDLFHRVDRVINQEELILCGLRQYVQQGRLSEDAASEWLDDYITKQNTI